jgi:Tfp pilus assembly protein PilN
MPGDSARADRSWRATPSSSSGTYLVLAALAGLVVFVSLWTIANHQIDKRTSDLKTANAQAQAATARAERLAPYEQFAALAQSRKATVASLSSTRFDWAHGLREVARVVPGDVWLTGINGSSGATPAAPGPTTSAAPAPRFEMTGCTKSQGDVARLMARLRAVDGVRSVELKSSVKPDAIANDDCPANKSTDPVFTIAISFAVPGSPKATVDSTGQVASSAPASPPDSTSAATPAGSGTATTPSTPAKVSG